MARPEIIYMRTDNALLKRPSRRRLSPFQQTLQLLFILPLFPFLLIYLLLKSTYTYLRSLTPQRLKPSPHLKTWPAPLSLQPPILTTLHPINAGTLARLPYDLRLQIYTHLLSNRPIRLALMRHKPRLSYPLQGPESHRLQPNILKTCRFIHSEAAHLLYTSNEFKLVGIQDLKAFECFTLTVRPERLASIRTLSVEMQAWECVTWSAAALENEANRLGGNFEPGEIFENPFWSDDAATDGDGVGPWNRLWHLIATRMPGLREIEVVLDPSGAVTHRESAYKLLPVGKGVREEWVRGMRAVRGLERWSVRAKEVDWSGRDSEKLAFERGLAGMEEGLKEKGGMER